jgi:hypothetical protein
LCYLCILCLSGNISSSVILYHVLNLA